MSKAFNTVPSIIVPPGKSVGVVRKAYDNMMSFEPKKRIFATIVDAEKEIQEFPAAWKAVAIYATAEKPSDSWERIKTIQ